MNSNFTFCEVKTQQYVYQRFYTTTHKLPWELLGLIVNQLDANECDGHFIIN